MSTKIYTAYRFPTAEFWPMVATIRERGHEAVCERFEEVLDKFFPDSAGCSTRWTRGGEAYREYRAQLSSPRRNEWDLTVTITFREFEGHVYVVPHCDMEMRDMGNFLADIDGLTDYAYWNHTDGPDEVTDEEWEHRGDTWRRMFKEPAFKAALLLRLLDEDTTDVFFRTAKEVTA